MLLDGKAMGLEQIRGVPCMRGTVTRRIIGGNLDEFGEKACLILPLGQ